MVLPIYFFLLLFLFLLADHVIPLSSASEECPSSFECGNLGRLSFPLTIPQLKDCGMLPILGCDEHHMAEKTVQFGEKQFQVTRIGKFNYVVSVRDKDLQQLLLNDSCDAFCYNITIPRSSALGSFYIDPTLTMYKCNSSFNYSLPKQFFNYKGCAKRNNETIFFRSQDPDDPPSPIAKCPRVKVPVNMMAFSADPFTFIASEFSIHIQLSDDCAACASSKGLCRLDSTRGVYCSKFKGMCLSIIKLALLVLFVWIESN